MAAAELGTANDQRRLGVGEEVLHLAQGIARVQRDKDDTCAQTCQVQEESLRRLVDLSDKPVAFRHAQLGEERGKPACRIECIGIAVRAAVARAQERAPWI